MGAPRLQHPTRRPEGDLGPARTSQEEGDRLGHVSVLEPGR